MLEKEYIDNWYTTQHVFAVHRMADHGAQRLGQPYGGAQDAPHGKKSRSRYMQGNTKA